MRYAEDGYQTVEKQNPPEKIGELTEFSAHTVNICEEINMPKQDKLTHKGKCVKNNCRTVVNTNIGQILASPFENLPADIQRLFSYFLHMAPDISSVHSLKIPETLHTELFRRMMDNRHFYYQKFCCSNATIQKELEQGFLSGDALCLKCKRYVCKKNKGKKGSPAESDLDCFLRHIRNAIAHGRVYYLHAGNRVHIIFEDTSESKNISARIVCIKADLEHWKKILEQPKNYKG